MKQCIALMLFCASLCMAADPAGFALWRPGDLERRQKALTGKEGPDHSARETLGDFGNHLVRLIHRNANGAPEQHSKLVDLWVVVSGEGTLVVGGKIINPRQMGNNGPNELTGDAIEGGERHAVAAGDVLHIPAQIPHAILVPAGKEITYMRVAIPAQ
jgi:mannose-6-phosphate isomerase-like protein (cupin superfamily)